MLDESFRQVIRFNTYTCFLVEYEIVDFVDPGVWAGAGISGRRVVSAELLRVHTGSVWLDKAGL